MIPHWTKTVRWTSFICAPLLHPLLGAGVADASAAPAPHGTMLPRPASGDHRLGAWAAVTGSVPGATGKNAVKLAGAAGKKFAQERATAQRQGRVSAQAVLHRDWGAYPPVNASNGMMATQSILPDKPIGGGDFLYAPTAKSTGHSCIELTTAYHGAGAVLWAWDWCGQPGAAKTVRMDAAFRATYTTTVNSRPAYTMSQVRSNTARNTWTVYLYNYKTQSWDTFWSQSGTDKTNYSFGWNTYEIWSNTNPSTGHGYFCDATRNTTIESSDIQIYAGKWTPATAANAPLSSRPPAGSSYNCPTLNFAVVSPNNDWTATNR
ncbi:hypothetical protein BTM25_52440 [Actinomadura rubteroloni]|uniref:Carbohydrate-binding protein n=1 Tax=Actinomadura rubteroloni TaxID=1926885 RepID=A0A2P4UDB4_9ACTN|nr:carbohydrate-binding protein [Actinomadura rubteroloni]POM23038.1 hypothetical protein BTM25_52440 [Actinomadura rubteroloni]